MGKIRSRSSILTDDREGARIGPIDNSLLDRTVRSEMANDLSDEGP